VSKAIDSEFFAYPVVYALACMRVRSRPGVAGASGDRQAGHGECGRSEARVPRDSALLHATVYTVRVELLDTV
jgi:hypothetical protein